MFGMSITEIGLIFILGLIVFGPERIPGVARTLGRFVRDMRRTAADIQRTFEVEEIRRELQLRNNTAAKPPTPKPPTPKPAVKTASTVSASAPPSAELAPPAEASDETPEAPPTPEEQDDELRSALRVYLDASDAIPAPLSVTLAPAGTPLPDTVTATTLPPLGSRQAEQIQAVTLSAREVRS